MTQLCSLRIFNPLWRKPMWWCLRSFWLMLSMRWGLWAGVSIVSALFFCQGAKHLPWGQGWRVVALPLALERDWFPETRAFSKEVLPCRLVICSYTVGSKGKGSSLQPSENAWAVGICLSTSCSNSVFLHGTSYLLKEGPYRLGVSHLGCMGKHESSWGAGGCWTGGCHGRVAKGHPMVLQLHPHHVKVSLGVCLAKPEEHRWNLFPIHNKRRVKPAGISCTLSVMTNYSRCWCIC